MHPSQEPAIWARIASISRESYHIRPISNYGMTSLDVTSTYIRREKAGAIAGTTHRFRTRVNAKCMLVWRNRIRGAAREFCCDGNSQASGCLSKTVRIKDKSNSE